MIDIEKHQWNLENLPSVDLDINAIAKENMVGYNDVNELLKAFEKFMAISKSITSQHTVSAYLGNVKQFLVWCNKLKIPIIGVITTAGLTNLIIYYERALTSTELSQNSRAQKQQSIKKFFEFRGFLTPDLFDLKKSFSRDFISTGDTNAFKKQTRINDAVYNAIKTAVDAGDINDKWIFFFMAFGCRRSEIATIKTSDIDWLNKEINIYQQKQGTNKRIPLPDWANESIIPIAPGTPAKGKPESGKPGTKGYIPASKGYTPATPSRKYNYLIFNSSKRSAKTRGIKPVTPQYIYTKLLRWRNETEYKSVALTPHSMRRYFVSNLLRHGASDSNIARLGGWSNSAMVFKYGYDISLDGNPIIKNNLVKY